MPGLLLGTIATIVLKPGIPSILPIPIVGLGLISLLRNRLPGDLVEDDEQRGDELAD